MRAVRAFTYKFASSFRHDGFSPRVETEIAPSPRNDVCEMAVNHRQVCENTHAMMRDHGWQYLSCARGQVGWSPLKLARAHVGWIAHSVGLCFT
jgi:hypothetical protein